MEQLYARLHYGKLVLFNEKNEQINNAPLFSLIQKDTVIYTNEVGTYFYTKPGIYFEANCPIQKVYMCYGKFYRVELPPNIPVLTKELFVECFKDRFFIYNERLELIENPTLFAMIQKDLVKGVDEQGEVCLYTKEGTQIKNFVEDDFFGYKYPIKEYLFEGQTLSIQLPPLKKEEDFDLLS